MVLAVIDRSRAAVPEAPGALYLRPLLFGTMPNIGAATTPTDEACLVVLASPVWDYFSGGGKPLSVYLEEHATRCASHLGMVKTGGNYAAALGPTLAARRDHKADQVLFCPGGEVQEAGAANFLAIRDGHILTRGLDSTFLHGVTRDALLAMAPDLGYRVEERNFTVDELHRVGEDRRGGALRDRGGALRRRHAPARRQVLPRRQRRDRAQHPAPARGARGRPAGHPARPPRLADPRLSPPGAAPREFPGRGAAFGVSCAPARLCRASLF